MSVEHHSVGHTRPRRKSEMFLLFEKITKTLVRTYINSTIVLYMVRQKKVNSQVFK